MLFPVARWIFTPALRATRKRSVGHAHVDGDETMNDRTIQPGKPVDACFNQPANREVDVIIVYVSFNSGRVFIRHQNKTALVLRFSVLDLSSVAHTLTVLITAPHGT